MISSWERTFQLNMPGSSTTKCLISIETNLHDAITKPTILEQTRWTAVPTQNFFIQFIQFRDIVSRNLLSRKKREKKFEK